MSASGFSYSEEVATRFPQVCAAIVYTDGVVNSEEIPGLVADFFITQAEVARTLEHLAPGERESIKAWRAVFTAFGVKPTRHRNAAEALLRRLQRHGDIPSFSPTVDLGNLISIRHNLPVAVFDLDTFEKPLTVRLADGTESFTGIGSSESESPAPDEVVFVDSAGAVAARRWCWKQGASAATQPSTTSAMFVIEAAHAEAPADVRSASSDLVKLIEKHFQNASVTTAYLP